MAKLDQVLYTANAHTTGGRDGASRTDDGRLDVKLSPPGTAGTGTNPEQLFAAGYSACFIGAMKAVAGMQKISLPGLDKATAQKLVDAAHQVCPYSNATRGNIDVTITLV